MLITSKISRLGQLKTKLSEVSEENNSNSDDDHDDVTTPIIPTYIAQPITCIIESADAIKVKSFEKLDNRQSKTTIFDLKTNLCT